MKPLVLTDDDYRRMAKEIASYYGEEMRFCESECLYETCKDGYSINVVYDIDLSYVCIGGDPYSRDPADEGLIELSNFEFYITEIECLSPDDENVSISFDKELLVSYIKSELYI